LAKRESGVVKVLDKPIGVNDIKTIAPIIWRLLKVTMPDFAEHTRCLQKLVCPSARDV
jgi:hypothetical protein